MQYYDDRYITNLPTEQGNLNQNEYEVLNNCVLDAIASALKIGHVSKYNKIFVDKIQSPKTKQFFRTTFANIDKNCKNTQVKVNFSTLGSMLIGDMGKALVTKLNRDNKILNWPNIIEKLSDPTFDFSDSEMLEYLANTAKDLNTRYSKDPYYGE